MKKYSKSRKPMRKRRSYKKKSTGRSIARTMQSKSLSYVKKKYTVVIPINVAVGEEFAETTISHMGGKNAANVINTLTINNCNPDNMLIDQMQLYQFFKITGVGFKIFFPEGTNPESTPVQWSMAYSSNQIIKPDISFDRL